MATEIKTETGARSFQLRVTHVSRPRYPALDGETFCHEQSEFGYTSIEHLRKAMHERARFSSFHVVNIPGGVRRTETAGDCIGEITDMVLEAAPYGGANATVPMSKGVK